MRERAERLLNFRFLVEIGGVIKGGFSDVSGLEQEIETEEFREGGNDFIHYLPKGFRHGRLTLKRGMTDSDDLWEWYRQTADSLKYPLQGLSRRDIYVIMLDETGGEQWRFCFKEACPVKWSGPQLSGMGRETAVETVEFIHRGFVKV